MSEWREEPLVFACGAQRLLAVLHRASDPAADCGVLIVVGGPSYRVGSHRQFTLMARSLASAGFPAMRFDHRGVGDSEGDPRSFEAIGDDIRSALEAFMAAVPSLRRLTLWGLCDAASAALLALPLHPAVAALTLANPWVRTPTGAAQAYLRHYYPARLLQPRFWGRLVSGGLNPLRAAAELLRTAVRAGRGWTAAPGATYVEQMRAALAAFHGPVLLLLSEQDLTAREFSDLCAASPRWRELASRPNVRIEHLAGADHTFSQRATLELVTEQTRAVLAALAARGQQPV